MESPTLQELDEVLSAEIDKRVYLVLAGYPTKPLSEYKPWKEIHFEKIAKLLEDPDGHAMNRLVSLRWIQLLDTGFSLTSRSTLIACPILRLAIESYQSTRR